MAIFLFRNTDMFMAIFGRTQLIMSLSRAKNCKESASDVHFRPAPPKHSKKAEKRNFETEKKSKKFGRRKMKRRESCETRFRKNEISRPKKFPWVGF